MRAGLAALAFCLAGCVSQPPTLIMPGYLDLPLQPGHVLETSEGPPVIATASLRRGDLGKVARAYRAALRSMGWVEDEANALMKKADGAQARCVSINEVVLVVADKAPDYSGWVRFEQRPCPPAAAPPN